MRQPRIFRVIRLMGDAIAAGKDDEAEVLSFVVDSLAQEDGVDVNVTGTDPVRAIDWELWLARIVELVKMLLPWFMARQRRLAPPA